MKKTTTNVNNLIRRLSKPSYSYSLLVLVLLVYLSPGKLMARDMNNLKKPDITIGGVVQDEEGNGLASVTISVQGSTQEATTNDEGKFSISVPNENAILVFSYIGFVTQEAKINGRTFLEVTLKSDVQALDEVVVVGYGTESTKKITTSVAKISEKQIKEMPINNVADAFTGNVSGVMVENGSGAPGTAPIIRVRGYGSINAGSEPLYVIDGMMVTGEEFRLLNPKSVESVSVLKDAAAGAIYGSRAGNGVIIVSTKSGSGKTKFNVNSTTGLQQVEKKIDVLSGPEFIEYSKKAYAISGEKEPVFSPDVANTNWQDEIFRTGVFQNHQISANGGNENMKYNISLNYLGNEGILLTTFENNYSSNGNFDIKLSKKLNLGFTYNASYTKNRVNDKLGGPGHGSGGIIEDAVVQYPVIPVYMENGDYGQYFSKEWGTPVAYGGYGNPVAALKEIHDIRNGFSGIGRTFLNYKVIEDLAVNVSFGGLVDTRYRDFNESPYLAANGHSREANFSNPRYDNIVAEQGNSMRTSYTTEGFVDYKRTFSDSHHFGVIGGFSMQYNGFRETNAMASINDRGANAGNPIPRFDNYYRPNIFGANDVSGAGGFSEETFASLFTRVNYDYKDKYLFMASVRRDGSSKFAPGNRYGIFPAISAAWRITEESFMQDGIFDELKLRLSYGISGNDQIGNYAWQGKLNFGGSQYVYAPGQFSDGPVTTIYPSYIENPNLKWETNEQYNLGLDFGVLNNRIQLASDFYIRNTKDMLLSRPIPSENGISNSIMDNIGDMNNKGIELALTTSNVATDNFTWTTNWIFNKVWSKVTSIHSTDGIIRLASGNFNMVWIVEGEEMFQIYGYKMLGVFETEEQLQMYPKPRGSKIGDPITEDLNKDGQINADDYQKLGSGLPNFTFGLSNTFEYKGFDLNIVIDGSQGASKYNPSFRNQSWVSPIEGNISKFIYDNAGKIYGQANLDYTGNRLTENSYHVFDASYIRIKNLTLGYTLPSRISNSLAISTVRLTLSAQNLHTFTSYPWFNPQANFYNGAAGSAQFGVDYGGYPLSKTYALGINITF